MTTVQKAEYNEKLRIILDEKKNEWTSNLKTLPPLLRSDPANMVEANALALSYRSMILDDIHNFVAELNDENKIIKQLTKDKFILFTTGLLPDGTRPKGNILNHPMIGVKMNKGEKDLIISGELSEFELTVELLSNVIDFLKESIKTIDHTLYSVKNRIDLFNYLK